MAWRDKIKQFFSRKIPRLKNCFAELQPDGRIAAWLVAPCRQQDSYEFRMFIQASAWRAIQKERIPDNRLVCFRGIPETDIPSTRTTENMRSFLSAYGKVSEENSVPLRKAAYLASRGLDITRGELHALEHSAGYRQFIAYETAAAKLEADRPARMWVTITLREGYARIFKDSLLGPKQLRDYLQKVADNFYMVPMKGTPELSVYRIETASRRLLELPTNREIPLTASGLEILKAYHPVERFNLCPESGNLLRLVTACSLCLSKSNRDILTLQDIAENGYAHLDIPFSFRKEFSSIERHLDELNRKLPYGSHGSMTREAIQEKAKETAMTLLAIHGIRFSDNKAGSKMSHSSQDIKKETPSEKTGMEKKTARQVKLKL